MPDGPLVRALFNLDGSHGELLYAGSAGAIDGKVRDIGFEAVVIS